MREHVNNGFETCRSEELRPVAIKPLSITVVGAGVLGLWQAITLARAGHRIRLIELSSPGNPFAATASRYAGAMVAPDTEAEAAPVLVRDLGREALAIWTGTVPMMIRGSLVVAPPREPGELKRFARLTERHRMLDARELEAIEPDLAGRFDAALHFPGEAHLAVDKALAALLDAARAAGVEVMLGTDGTSALTPDASRDWTIDCRGRAAAADLPDLRGVRGERVLVRAPDVTLGRPVRLLHPRVPLYVVPWPDHVFMIGATVIESDDDGPMTVRSALELLNAAYALHPGFAEAAIVETGAGVRPALPDNVPRAMVEGQRRVIRVNGAYRHGFLLSPILARSVSAFFNGDRNTPLLEID